MLSLVVFALFCIDVDSALPVPDIMNSGDKWNFLLLGSISVIGMGAILACVRCRRKKRGFEEFKNDATKAERTATTVEAIRTEFPIFQALSTPSSPQFQQLDNESSRDSRDDLHVSEVDEIVAPSKVIANCDAPRITFGGLQHDNYLERRAPDALGEETIVLTFDAPGEGGEAGKDDEKTFIYRRSVTTTMEPADDSAAGATITVPHASTHADDDPEYENSVELALRELDIAIGDDNDSDDGQDDEEGSLNGHPVEDDEEHLENVLRQLFIDNMLSGVSAEEEEEEEDQQREGHVIEAAMAEDNAVTAVGKTEEEQKQQQQETEEVETEENFFDDLPAICQSTPSVKNKREAVALGEAGGGRPKPAALFNEHEMSSPNGAEEGGEADGTFVLPTVRETQPRATNQVPRVEVCQDDSLGDRTIEGGASGVASETDPGHNYLKDSNVTITPVNTPIEVTFEYAENAGRTRTGAGGEGEMTFTKDLDCFDEPSSSEMGGWFLHPQEPGDAVMPAAGDATFDYENLPPPPPPLHDDYCAGLAAYEEHEEDSDGEWGETSGRATTDFDALRKQLADLLPHAQGAPALDDEGAVGGSCESGMPANVLEAMLNNMDPSPAVVAEPSNYKRPLSPIMEESEEENTTIKTSILNFDSTSTGCIETLSEAVMGVTRTLSNDTLFNFEDTLGDREDSTPTPTAASVGVAAAYSAVTLSPGSVARTLDETFAAMEQHRDSTFAVPEQRPGRPNKLSMSLDLSAAVRADNYTSALDVVSPEQQKTFSEDINSVEHVSGSDASGNLDPDGTYTTNTIEMATCISLNKDEGEEEECDPVEDLEKDDRVSAEDEDVESDSEESPSSRNALLNNTTIAEATAVVGSDVGADPQQDHHGVAGEDEAEMDDGSLPREDPLEQTKLFLAREIDYSRWHKVSCVDAAVFHVQIQDQVPDLELDLDKCLGMGEKETRTLVSPVREDKSNNNVTFDMNENLTVGRLSGEEDPWGTDSHGNGRGEGHRETDEMVTVFNSEWEKESEGEEEEEEDSDNNAESDEGGRGGDVDGQSVDSSDSSSEEFMYVGGNNLPPSNPSNGHGGADTWEAHVDQIAIGKRDDRQFETVTEEDEEDAEEEEEGDDGEFIPSSWNSNAKPSRSAMKSPDKSSSDEDTKDVNLKRRPRNVAFKKQQYHSVYEYPREMNPLSPSLSEPTFSINFRDQVSSSGGHSAIGDIDGFMISSSTRPFQNNNQCNTWPTESDFSWSQHMPENECSPVKLTEGTVVYSEIPIEWPRKVVIPEADADDSGSESNPVPRPDSGVGESAEFLHDPVALGELCHTKATLRLPLAHAPPPTAPMAGDSKGDSDEELPKESADDNMALPTPSCTGSMDSLSSSSCSDRQMTSFTTFGKGTPLSSLDETVRLSMITTGAEVKLTVSHDSGHGDGHDDYEEEEEESGVLMVGNGGIVTALEGDRDAEKLGNKRISDSTDEDSGIENISRKIN